MENTRTTSFYVTYLRGTSIEMDYGTFSVKPFTKLSYHEQSSMGFKRNELGTGLNHCIVCRTEPILGTCVCFGMASNVIEGSSHFRRTKVNLSISRVPKTGLFVKHLKIPC